MLASMLGRHARVGLSLCFALAGCASDDAPRVGSGPSEVPSGPFLDGDCDPLVPTACALPFPSDAFTTKDESTITGKHVEFGPTTLPGLSDPAVFRLSDGFSPGAGLMAHFPGATVTGLPTPLDIASSLEDGSPTVLIEADSGERVPHFSELDMSDTDDTRRAFIIRPVVRLKSAKRYIVAIRNVVDASGTPLAPSPAFQALRDDAPSD